MAARAERHRHRHLFPDQRRGARADHAVTRPRGHPGRHRSRRLFRRNGRDRRPAPFGRHPRHHRRHHRPHAGRGVPRDHPQISRRRRAIAPAARLPHPHARSAGQRIQLHARQEPHLRRAAAAVAARSTDQRRAIVSPPPVHSDIAARVSTRREMVARELKALERAGLLTKRRGAFVLNNVPEMVRMVQSD